MDHRRLRTPALTSVRPPATQTPLEQEAAETTYRNALRAVEDIARRALAGHGEKRETALMDISRIAGAGLRRGMDERMRRP
jgi:hypothetical protein